MSKNLMTILFFLLGLTICGIGFADEKPVESDTPPTTTEPEEVVVTTTSYIMRFHRNVRDGNGMEKNVVASPFGAARIGEMLYDGAEGKTKTALRQAFLTTMTTTTSKETTVEETENWFRLPKDEAKELPFVAVDGLWGQKDFPFLPIYIDGLRKKFAPEIAEADFSENAEAECARINNWVDKATAGRIEKLFEKIDSNTRLVLVNAIYFLGKWDTPFDPNETKSGPFQSVDGNHADVPFMHKTMRVGYQEGDWGQAIELPYEHNRCSMVVILPDKELSLDKLESRVRLSGDIELVSDLVDIRFPKFEIASDIDLNPVLTAMGAGIAFDRNEADFSPMSGSGGLYVGQAKQKVFVRIDESGTEAAAATGAAVGLKSVPTAEVPPKTFHADRPFLFMIRENTTNTPLFIGRFVKP